MIPSKSLSSLKGMLPRINHPLPLNEKSQKKLLDTLTTSFRKHLDREHGWADDDSTETASKMIRKRTAAAATQPKATTTTPHTHHPTTMHTASHTRPPPLSSSTSLPSSPSSPSGRPTDRHLRAILTNPLFSYDQTVGRGGGAGAERDPMAIFDWAVARGLMTPKRAAGCLLAKRREAVQSAQLSPAEAMAASGAGLRVVKWLQAAGLERDLSFVGNAQLMGVLVPFLVAEGLDAIVWDWLARLREMDSPYSSYLLHKLVQAKAEGAATLDEAYRAMARGAGLFDRASPAFERNVFWPWCALSWLSTFKAWNLRDPTPRLYETFVSIMDHDQRPSILLERAHLDLRHPTHPTPAPAVALLQDDHLLRDVQASTSPVEPPPGRRPGYPSRIVSMGLDTVRHLAFVGQPEEAQKILDRLRQQFGSQLDQVPMHT